MASCRGTAAWPGHPAWLLPFSQLLASHETFKNTKENMENHWNFIIPPPPNKTNSKYEEKKEKHGASWSFPLQTASPHPLPAFQAVGGGQAPHVQQHQGQTQQHVQAAAQAVAIDAWRAQQDVCIIPRYGCMDVRTYVRTYVCMYVCI